MAQEQGPVGRTLDEAEFTALEDVLIAQAPPGLSESDFERWITPRLDQAVAQAEYAPATPQGSALGRAASGAWEMLNPVEAVKGLYRAATHPIDTVSNLAGAQLGQLKQGATAASEGRLGEGFFRTLAGALPIAGPIAANIGEEIGATGDIARGVGQAAGLVAPVPGVRATVAAGRRVLTPALRGRVAGALERGAEARVTDVGVPKGVTKANIQRGRDFAQHAGDVTAMLAEDGAGWSRDALRAQVAGKLDDAEKVLDEAQDARLSARTFDTRPIVEALEARKRTQTAEAVEASRTIREASPPPAKAVADYGKSVATHAADAATLQARERAFMLRWLADDLDEVTYSSGTMTKQARDRAAREWRPGDPEGARHGIGAMSARTPGTPVYHTVDPLVKGAYHVKSKRLAKLADDLVAGKDVDPRVVALADAYIQGFAGDRFDFTKLNPATVDALGLRPKDLKAPMTPPKYQRDPGMASRWFGEERVRQDIPDAAVAMDPMPPGKPPGPSLKAVPLGRDVVPAPNKPRVGTIDQIIAEVKALGPVARYESLRRIRQSWDPVAKEAINAAVTPDYNARIGAKLGARDGTGALRDFLAQVEPETAKANAPYHAWRTLDDIMEAAEDRARVQPKVGRRIIAQLGGLLAGAKTGGVVTAIAGATLAPQLEALLAGSTTKLQTARLLTKLAAAVKRGDVGAVTSHAQDLKVLGRRVLPTAAREVGRTATDAVAEPVPQPY